ncbi:hypothetical protein CIHG_06386 [Coccidioides immitis H538.4]|uniref:Uncharacterized protein n=3 Tax=Coccidioides immitis TaxID=5501 RepID=A0A0J8U2I7_COCIT|nr:hypothetical protein CIRG_10198 [Coccidioides immitis RMSCC 2394]KMU80867.1 hypothetical protein CISG_08538 [Coccidioides immitis RMSCC 3703]KMU88718.1 hypothetical protein CIHG_06386 [Coccidioides immitis H538.4]
MAIDGILEVPDLQRPVALCQRNALLSPFKHAEPCILDSYASSKTRTIKVPAGFMGEKRLDEHSVHVARPGSVICPGSPCTTGDAGLRGKLEAEEERGRRRATCS